MKKLLAGLIGVCLTLVLFAGSFGTMASARADTSGDYGYTVADSNATITGYTGVGGVVVIPSTLGGHPVTAIDERTFGYCLALTSVTIPASVTSIGDTAFTNCTRLTSVTIGSGVTTIGDGAFGNCSALISITVDAGNASYFSSTDSVLFNKTVTSLVAYPGGKQGAYVIPNSVTSIGAYAFYNCTTLTSVTIPASVTSIDYRAFWGCTGLTSITIPNSATSIGIEAFYGCAPSFTIHHAGGTTGETAGQTGRDKGGKIILFSIIFLIALLIIFGIRFAIQRHSN